MPLARIISRRSEDALSLVNELHAQGYEVEVFAPDEPMEGEADLELTIETVPVTQAGAIVESRANGNADLFVAPGVMAPVVDETAAAAQVRAQEEQSRRERNEQERIALEQKRAAEEAEQRVLAERRRVAEEAERQRVLSEQLRQAEAAERERQRLLAAEAAARERREAEERRLAALEAQRAREEQKRVAREERERREKEARARIAREAEEERIALEAQRRAAAQEEQGRSAFRRLEEAAILRAQALEDERHRALELHDRFDRDEKGRLATEREQADVAETERLAALASVKTAEEDSRAAAEQARLRVEQEERLKADAEVEVRKEQREREERQREIAAALAARSAAGSDAGYTSDVRVGEAGYAAAMKYAATAEPNFRALKLTRQHRYAAAAAAALVMTIGLAVGWVALANRRPADPLGNAGYVPQNLEQQSPFGSTTVKPALNPSPSTGPQRAASQQPVRSTTVNRQASVASRAQKPAAATAPARHSRRVAQDDVAEDVVVRHYANGKPLPVKATAQAQTKQQQQAGLKKISDLN
jgi:hypothetical protein